MARIRVRKVGKGLHPSEVIVAVATADGGEENLVVDLRSLENETLSVGYPIGQESGRVLVELPRETLRGLWRVWVSPDMIVGEVAA